jgi:phosphate transport system permease protein
VIARVVLPSSLSGLVTGSLLAVARGMGETAPLLFTVSVATVLTGGLSQQMNTLPIQIYNDIQSPRNAIEARAWGAGLTLVALVLIFNVLARLISRRSRMA